MSRFNLEGNCNQKNVNEDGKFFNENLLGHNFTLKKKDNFGSKATLFQWQNDVSRLVTSLPVEAMEITTWLKEYG